MRECGECTLCCLVTRVPELDKPENTMCTLCDAGCTIYNDRPQSCRAFDCAWLLGAMDEDQRPDKIHVVIETLPDESVVLALIEPGYEDVLPTLNESFSEFTERGVSVAATNRQVLLGKGSVITDVQRVIAEYARDLGVTR
jgi:hypothetical protein